MNPKVPLCALHEGYDFILPLFYRLKYDSSNQGSPDTLTPQEAKWRDVYHFLLERGFELRPRYRPGWIPSWLGTNFQEWDCEDGYGAIFPLLLDAMYIKPNRVVCIKMISKKTNELEIGRYLVPDNSNSPQSPRNHCVPILDSFRNPVFPDVSYIVMPLLRPFDNPEFGAIGEVIDFTTQVLEGMEYMHSKLVAHCDLTGANIMMDASPILPQGWHFNALEITADGTGIVAPLARIDHPVRYYIIDYDCSVRFQPGQSPIIHGLGGRDDDVPELRLAERTKPFDHFKLDVFTLGNVFLKDLRQKYSGLGFLNSLIKLMMTKDFRQRPTAQEALDHWYEVRSKLSPNIARVRLRKPDASVGDTVMNTLADGMVSLAWLFDEEPKSRLTP